MDQTFDIRVVERGTKGSVRVTERIPAEDWALVLPFLDEFERLQTFRPLRTGMQLQVTFHWSATEGGRHSAELPPSEDVSAVLHLVRPFVLKKEPTSFLRVRNIMDRRLAHPLLRGELARLKDLFSGKSFQRQVVIQLGPSRTVMNSDTMVEKWLNAHEYHRDREKREELRALTSAFPDEVTRGIFISMMLDKVRAVTELVSFISVLRNGGQFTLTVE